MVLREREVFAGSACAAAAAGSWELVVPLVLVGCAKRAEQQGECPAKLIDSCWGQDLTL